MAGNPTLEKQEDQQRNREDPDPQPRKLLELRCECDGEDHCDRRDHGVRDVSHLLSRAFVRTCSVKTVVGGSDREAGHHRCSEEQVVGYEEVGHRLDDCLNREGGGDTERDRGRIGNDETDLVPTW